MPSGVAFAPVAIERSAPPEEGFAKLPRRRAARRASIGRPACPSKGCGKRIGGRGWLSATEDGGLVGGLGGGRGCALRW